MKIDKWLYLMWMIMFNSYYENGMVKNIEILHFDCGSFLTKRSKYDILENICGLPPRRRHAIIWTNAGILLIGPIGTNFS